MEEVKKKKANPVLIFIIIMFIVFISLYFAGITNLYQYGQYNKMTITKEAMEKFESDVDSGKNIKIEDYLDTTTKDYTTPISKLGNKTSKMVETFMTKGIKETFRVISVLFTGNIKEPHLH